MKKGFYIKETMENFRIANVAKFEGNGKYMVILVFFLLLT